MSNRCKIFLKRLSLTNRKQFIHLSTLNILVLFIADLNIKYKDFVNIFLYYFLTILTKQRLEFLEETNKILERKLDQMKLKAKIHSHSHKWRGKEVCFLLFIQF